MADASPFRIPPSQPHVLHVSGGRSSGYLLRRILDANDGLPGNVIPIFCNTGKERPETLDFVARMGAEWGVHITWLEYRYREDAAGGTKDPKVHYEVVSHNSASRNGEPFEALIGSRKMLPNQNARVCTMELKVLTAERYLRRAMGLRPATDKRPADYVSFLGIRYDEPRRWKKAAKEHCNSSFPLVSAGIKKEDVGAYWKGAPFDLGIPSWMGNCDLCFLKGKQTLLRTIRENPKVADWWADQELLKRGNGSFAQFSKRHSVKDLLDMALSTPTLPILDDEGGVDCFCGD